MSSDPPGRTQRHTVDGIRAPGVCPLGDELDGDDFGGALLAAEGKQQVGSDGEAGSSGWRGIFCVVQTPRVS